MWKLPSIATRRRSCPSISSASARRWNLCGESLPVKNIPIVEDACQAIGAQYRGRKAGVLGRVGCFSFFPTKNLGGAGDGGIITTDDAELAARLKRLRVHGDVGGYNHVEVGFNSRLDALQAAVLRVKLRHLENWSDARRKNARRYGELFRNLNLLSSIDVPTIAPDHRHVFNQYTIRVRGGMRDAVMDYMRAEGGRLCCVLSDFSAYADLL